MSWDRHPAIRSGTALTRGEKAADTVRNNMGSWPFVFIASIFLTIWMLYNRNTGFDPYPFILLNLVLSCVAAMQGAILLIAAKREDQISSDLAAHTFEIDQENLLITKRVEELTAEVHRLTLEIHRHLKTN